MIPGFDPITVVERSYALGEDDQAWLDGVVDAILPGLDHGMGLFALYFEVEANHAVGRVHCAKAVGDSEQVLPVMRASLPIAERAAVTEGIVYAPLAGTLTDTLANGASSRTSQLAREFYRSLGFEDTAGITIADPTGFALIIHAPMREQGDMQRRHRVRWSRVAAHVSAGLRLRRRLTSADPDTADAVIEPCGKLSHAAGDARTRRAREGLADAVKAVEQARCNRDDEQVALELWRGLVDGTWSLVDHYDTDGRRYVVARRNAPEIQDPRALSERERQVAAYLAKGYANKLIGYYLGLSVSTVAGHVARIGRKLGCDKRVDLVQLLRALGGDRAASADPASTQRIDHGATAGDLRSLG